MLKTFDMNSKTLFVIKTIAQEHVSNGFVGVCQDSLHPRGGDQGGGFGFPTAGASNCLGLRSDTFDNTPEEALDQWEAGGGYPGSRPKR